MVKNAHKKASTTQTTLNNFVGASSSSVSNHSDSEYKLSDEDQPKAPNWWTRVKARN